jgi:hypothetical protein
MLKLKVNKFIREKFVKIHGLKTVLLANVILCMIVSLVILLGDVLYKCVNGISPVAYPA